MIDSAEKLDISVRLIAAKIAGPVGPSIVLVGEWIRNETLRSEFRLRNVVSTYARASNQQLSGHANRHQLVMAVDDVSALIWNRLTDGYLIRTLNSVSCRPNCRLG